MNNKIYESIFNLIEETVKELELTKEEYIDCSFKDYRFDCNSKESYRVSLELSVRNNPTHENKCCFLNNGNKKMILK